MANMPMLEPKELEERRHHRVLSERKKRHKLGFLPLIVLIAVMYITVVLIMPVAALRIQPDHITLPQKPEAPLTWPAYGQAAVGAVGYGMLAQHGQPKPLPIASVAKVVAALAVLKQRPLYKGQTPPVITITADDVATYNKYAAQDQSVVAVETGEQITQYQALQALLLPSANNMADVLVRWAFGSTDNYLKYVNPFTQTIGMKNTHIADASGFSPDTVSTAADLTKLAEIAMNNPILADIVSQAQADIPVAGTVHNVNRLLGRSGVIGIKTGNTDEAGGCYMIAVRRAVDPEHQITVVGTIMGADNLSQAMTDALPLIDSVFKQFHTSDIVHDSQIFGQIYTRGGPATPLVAKRKLSVMVWDNQVPDISVTTASLGSGATQGEEVGHADVKVGDMAYSVPLTPSVTIKPPSFMWRLRHAAGYL